MKVLLCHKFYYPYRGSERYVLGLRKNLADLGITVIDFSTIDGRNVPSAYSPYFVEGADLSGIRLDRPVKTLRSVLNLLYSFPAGRSVARLARDCKPDIAHIHNIYHHLSSSVLQSLRKAAVPCVMTVHDYKLVCPNYRLFSGGKICQKCQAGKYFHAAPARCVKGSFLAGALLGLEAYLCRFLRAYELGVRFFIAPSRFMQGKLAEFGIPPEKIVYLPYSVGLEGLEPRGESGNFILYFGEISFAKGVHTFLKSLRLAGNFPVKLIGDGPDRAWMQRYCKENKLAQVEFLGYKPGPELYPYIRSCLFTVVPSQWYEVSGLSIYESFAASKCVIGSAIAGIPELVEDGRTGLLFKPGDENELAQKIRYLLENPQKAGELGRNGRALIQRLNDPSVHCRRLLEIYEKAMRN